MTTSRTQRSTSTVSRGCEQSRLEWMWSSVDFFMTISNSSLTLGCSNFYWLLTYPSREFSMICLCDRSWCCHGNHFTEDFPLNRHIFEIYFTIFIFLTLFFGFNVVELHRSTLNPTNMIVIHISSKCCCFHLWHETAFGFCLPFFGCVNKSMNNTMTW